MDSVAPKVKAKSGWLNIAVDYGPILIFFLVYRHYSPTDGSSMFGEIGAVIRATIAFMVSAVAALAFSLWRLGRISPMLWLSTSLIIVFGGITVWTRNSAWIEHKPTLIYLSFGIVLVVGFIRGSPLLKHLLDAAFEGLSDAGWLKLSRNWGVFFFFLAVLNEAVIAYSHWKYPGVVAPDQKDPAFQFWISAKVYLFMPLSFLFTFTQLPMLLKHGLMQEAEGEVLADPPHE